MPFIQARTMWERISSSMEKSAVNIFPPQIRTARLLPSTLRRMERAGESIL